MNIIFPNKRVILFIFVLFLPALWLWVLFFNNNSTLYLILAGAILVVAATLLFLLFSLLLMIHDIGNLLKPPALMSTNSPANKLAIWRPIAALQSIATTLSRQNDKIKQFEVKLSNNAGQLAQTNQKMLHEIIEHKRTTKELQYRMEFGHLVTTMSSTFISLAPDEIDAWLYHAFQAVGEFFGADHLSVFVAAHTEHKQQQFVWQLDNDGANIGQEALPPDEMMALWGEQLDRSENIALSITDSAASTEERNYLQRHAIKSLLIVPIIYSGSFIGFLHLQTKKSEHSWSNDIIALLKLLGEIFINALKRKQSELELSKHRQHLETLVTERTAEISKTNNLLQLEIDERQKTQQMLAQKNDELTSALEQLKQSQAKILQQDKMASIGQLAAGIAHEINNPAGFVAGNLQSLMRSITAISDYFQYIKTLERTSANTMDTNKLFSHFSTFEKEHKINLVMTSLQPLITDCQDGVERIKKIVNNLRTFSHIDEAINKPTNINDELDNTLNIVATELNRKAQVHKQYGKLPLINAYPQQLNQAFTNILVNAAQAISAPGMITIKTWAQADDIYIKITDNGCGMSQSALSHIFEPFYTSKDVGKGTGLGLSITYDIIKQHQGEITVISQIDNGSAFTIRLPIPIANRIFAKT